MKLVSLAVFSVLALGSSALSLNSDTHDLLQEVLEEVRDLRNKHDQGDQRVVALMEEVRDLRSKHEQRELALIRRVEDLGNESDGFEGDEVQVGGYRKRIEALEDDVEALRAQVEALQKCIEFTEATNKCKVGGPDIA